MNLIRIEAMLLRLFLSATFAFVIVDHARAAEPYPGCSGLGSIHRVKGGAPQMMPGDARPLVEPQVGRRFTDELPMPALYAGKDVRPYLWSVDHYDSFYAERGDSHTHGIRAIYATDKARVRRVCAIEYFPFRARAPERRIDFFYGSRGELREARTVSLDRVGHAGDPGHRACFRYDARGRITDYATVYTRHTEGCVGPEGVDGKPSRGDVRLRLYWGGNNRPERILIERAEGVAITTLSPEGVTGATRIFPVLAKPYEDATGFHPVPILLDSRPLGFSEKAISWPSAGAEIEVGPGNEWEIRRVRPDAWRDAQRYRHDVRFAIVADRSKPVYEVLAKGRGDASGLLPLSPAQRRQIWELLLGPSPRLLLVRGIDQEEIVPIPPENVWSRCIDPKADVKECSVGAP